MSVEIEGVQAVGTDSRRSVVIALVGVIAVMQLLILVFAGRSKGEFAGAPPAPPVAASPSATQHSSEPLAGQEFRPSAPSSPLSQANVPLVPPAQPPVATRPRGVIPPEVGNPLTALERGADPAAGKQAAERPAPQRSAVPALGVAGVAAMSSASLTALTRFIVLDYQAETSLTRVQAERIREALTAYKRHSIDASAFSAQVDSVLTAAQRKVVRAEAAHIEEKKAELLQISTRSEEGYIDLTLDYLAKPNRPDSPSR